ncbi:MAG: hypothetical protein EHM41_05410 [Chloroflexi bacterium]|nr:MAG: hypothetical protein EHM41_05410 [Chloroflexota bacterium]
MLQTPTGLSQDRTQEFLARRMLGLRIRYRFPA